jgi:hypothetical protein
MIHSVEKVMPCVSHCSCCQPSQQLKANSGQDDAMKLIGQEGPRRFLIEVEPVDGIRMVRILDLDQGFLFRVNSLYSTTARGHWEDYTAPQSKLQNLLRRVIEY